MKKMPPKKGAERKSRRLAPGRSSAESKKQQEYEQECCSGCQSRLLDHSRSLFVEEEVGRLFCSEDCIVKYFSQQIQRFEKEYLRQISTSDLNATERGSLAHLRWSALNHPDEVWAEDKTSGDRLYRLIKEYPARSKDNSELYPIWCVCICLFLRGEPSFLFLAFPTRDEALVNLYRKGERLKRDGKQNVSTVIVNQAPDENSRPILVDGLADAWTTDETIRAQLGQQRRADDIPQEEYELYQGCLEETLQTPDEVWSTVIDEEEGYRLYYFIKFYPSEDPSIWYIIVARDTDDQEQIEILEAFPTRDSLLIENYRTGTQEVGAMDLHAASRMIH
jgi:hypothetical protein